MLDKLLVLELASVLAGPSVGQFLAELGARVIKIENPRQGGDVTRRWHTAAENPAETASYFWACNFGKESLALDLSQPEGRDVLRRLVSRADVVLTSFGPGSAERLGLADGDLRAWNPGLITAAVSGYGAAHPRPGYDAVIQAESGFMSINGAPDGPPTKMPVALVDLLAAHHLKEAVLLALLRKAQTGEGASVSVSLEDAALVSLANQATAWLATGVAPTRMGSTHPAISPYGTLLVTRDQKEILLAVGTDGQFRALCRALGRPGLIDDPRFASNAERVRNRAVLEEALRGAAHSVDSAPLLAALERDRVPAGPVNSLPEALSGPAARRLGLPDKDGLPRGLTQIAASGLPLAQNERGMAPPPALGAHSRQVLIDLTDLDPAELDHLEKNHIVLQHA